MWDSKNKSIIYIIYQERKTFDLYFWEEINCFLNTLKYSYEIIFTFQIYMNIVPYDWINFILRKTNRMFEQILQKCFIRVILIFELGILTICILFIIIAYHIYRDIICLLYSTYYSSWWFRYIFCSIKYIFKMSFTFRVLITITQKAYQTHSQNRSKIR
jgi:hypothetical protein